MTKGNFKKTTATLSLFLLAYLLTVILHNETLSNIISPLISLMSAAILYFTYLKSDRAIKMSITLLLYALGCAVWGVADIAWAIISFSGGNPDESTVVQIVYALTNVVFLFSLIIFVIHQYRKWDLIQFGIDLFVTGFLSIVLFWILFMQKDLTVLSRLMASDPTSIFSLVSDVLIGIGLLSLFMSVRNGRIPKFLHIISAGIFSFAVFDMLYYFFSYNGLYVPNSITDFLYVLAIAIAAFGALWKLYHKNTFSDLSVMTNVGTRRKWVYLMLFPVVMVIDVLTGFVKVHLTVIDFLSLGVPIFLYWAACKYVQLALEKEALLKHGNALLEQRVAEQVSELKFLANQDTLTSLFNRRYFTTCLEESISSLTPSDALALLIMDMDRFKTINDTFGHDIGDRILLELSFRLIEWNNFGATIARLGGDEFAFLFVGKYSQKDIEGLCSEITELCAEPFKIDENTLNLTISIGVALLTEEMSDGKTLMQNADIAMYRAKSQGYNRYQVYDALMSQDFKKTVEIEFLLRQTDPEKDFELFYQPQYALPGKELIGAEALLRWKNPDHGYIPPNIFIPIAEQIDYIFKIGKWVMQETIRQTAIWNKQYNIPLKVGFNISPKQFNDKGFIPLIKALVLNSDVNPNWIDAEITESIMLNEGENVNDTFSVLRDLGVSVSIDDFGSGYSALGYLNKYPFDRIKIDKTLIDNINSRNISGANVVNAAVNMAHASGIQTIAEGVETQEQLDVLIALGCDQVQGFLLGRPVPADIFEKRYIEPHSQDAKIC